MNARKQGFSLVEVFVSLMLIAACVHVLMKEQARIAVFQKKIQLVQPIKQAGFSLSELLIGLALSMTLLIVLMQALTSVGHQYYKTHHAIRESLELQWFYELLNARVYHAGFTPCARLDNLVRIDARMHSNVLPSLEVSDKGDKLIAQGMNESAFSLAHVESPQVLSAKAIALKKDKPIIIADCKHAEVHTLSAVKSRKKGVMLYLNEPLVFEYVAKEMYVGEWLSQSFYFKNQAVFYRKNRADHVLFAEKAWFELKKKGRNQLVATYLTSALGKIYTLYTESRMS